MKTFNKNQGVLYFGLVCSILMNGCKKFVEVESPATRISEVSAYATDATAISVLTGIYTRMSADRRFAGSGGLTIFTGLSADELTLFNGAITTTLKAFYTNALVGGSLSQLTVGGDHWSAFYGYVFNCNSAIEGLTNNTLLRPKIQRHLLGEAKFLRALFYFYLVNMYGDVPLIMTTNYKENSVLARVAKDKVYEAIVADLIEAKSDLSEEFLDASLLNSTSERVRATKWAAIALLSRVYLYIGEWTKSESEASAIISKGSLFSLNSSLNTVFLKNSNEAIWQLQPTVISGSTDDGITFVLNNAASGLGPATTRPVYASTQLLSAFETNDQRAVPGNWIDSVRAGGILYYFPAKYKKVSAGGNEYLMMFRLAEQYLIRAEARLQLGKQTEAKADLDVIRNRAGLSGYAGLMDKNSLIAAIIKERQVELFTELGQRWFDLKRLGIINTVMPTVTAGKGGVWDAYDQFYPIPFNDTQSNPYLTQTFGY